MRIIERIKKGKCTAEIALMEDGVYRFSVYSNGDSPQYDVSYTPVIQVAYMWLVGLLCKWSDAVTLYKHAGLSAGGTTKKRENRPISTDIVIERKDEKIRVRMPETGYNKLISIFAIY